MRRTGRSMATSLRKQSLPTVLVAVAIATLGVALLGYYYMPRSLSQGMSRHIRYQQASLISGSQGATQLQAAEAGPGSTKLGVVTYRSSTGAECVAVQESAGLGEGITAGKPARPIENCAKGNINPGLMLHPAVAPAFGLIFDDEGHVWISPTGQWYMLQFGRVASRVARVSIASARGQTLSAPVMHGWWAIAVPYSEALAGFSQTFLSSGGSVLGQLGPRGTFCAAGPTCS